MKVQELIEILEDCDPEAQVLVMSQEQWPFEQRVVGAVTREDLVAAAGEEDTDGYRPPRQEEGTSPSDVFIVEGEQLRYGSRLAWELARK